LIVGLSFLAGSGARVGLGGVCRFNGRYPE
jgi:hypothetical protein